MVVYTTVRTISLNLQEANSLILINAGWF